MKTYQQHLADTQSHQKAFQSNRKPVYNGSAIFPVFHTQNQQTRILFMGYWMVKKKINEIGLLVSLRNQYGDLIYRYSEQIMNPAAKEIELIDLLNKSDWLDKEFIGSIELEVFSSRDLIFPYPAFVVNYYNNLSSAVVHSTGRVYEKTTDFLKKEDNVKEAGFDLIGTKDIVSFFTFVNGNLSLEDITLELEFINANNESDSIDIFFDKIRPYQTMKVVLNDYFDLNNFLGGKTGTIKIKHPFTSFFPRFIAGNYHKRSQAVGVTHTFYDNSENESPTAYWENIDRELMYDSAVFIPLFLSQNEYTLLQFYPIYSPSIHSIDLIFYSARGEQLFKIENFKLIKKDSSNFQSLDFKQILEENRQDNTEKVSGVLIVKSWDENKIPTRLKYGLNVGLKNKSLDIPTNICFASQISNLSILKKKGTFKWFPLIGSSNSMAIIQNASFLKKYSKPANIRLNYYSKDKDISLVEERVLAPFEQVKILYDDKLIEKFNDETIWITVISDNPFVNAWYFTVNQSGVVGGDHSF